MTAAPKMISYVSMFFSKLWPWGERSLKSTKLSTADSDDPTGSSDDPTRLCWLNAIDRLPLIQIKRRTPGTASCLGSGQDGVARDAPDRSEEMRALSATDRSALAAKLGTGLVERRDTVAVARYPGQAILLAGAWFGDAKDY
jgi:hypothetical protein